MYGGSGIFKSGDPVKRAQAIVKAVITNYNDPKILAEISEDLGKLAYLGINNWKIQLYVAEKENNENRCLATEALLNTRTYLKV